MAPRSPADLCQGQVHTGVKHLVARCVINELLTEMRDIGSLESGAAQAFLESMPMPDQPMPTLAVSEREAVIPIPAGRNRSGGFG